MSTSLRPVHASGTRERIIASATSLFAARGFKGTTTRLIADLAQVNEALIYRHFPNKGGLYAAIIEKKIAMLTPLLNRLRRAAEASESMETVLREIAREMFASVEKDPQFLRIFYFSGLEGHDLSRMFFEAYIETFNQHLSSFFLSKIREGTLCPMDPMLAGRAFSAIILHNLVVQTLFPESKGLPEGNKAIDAFVDLFLYGILRRPS
ncbi:TetR/AcrR family transcriptional regulator [Verrucomicrobium sp. 3C]|uniref:TetR/AcrR family transcriptional regulator n=1 Tax=Verrucomicrobium sp. 3C TaxID=1134055 RepID=UPI00036A47CF|nr:TetR/AcrR family transcriptional regulator [Verrucomicrobium sp. 3C]